MGLDAMILVFFIVQLSHAYMTTGKNIALTVWTFVCKVISLLFNMLSRLVITFLPRSKRPLSSWLQSPSAVILDPPKIKSDTVSTVSPSICHEVKGPDAMILVFWMLSLNPGFLFFKPMLVALLIDLIFQTSHLHTNVAIFAMLRLPGEISITSDMQMTPPLWQQVKKNWRASWWKWKRRVKKLA